MQADREDAPFHLQGRQNRRGKWPVLVGGLVGISITAAFLYAASKQPLFVALLNPPPPPVEQVQHNVTRTPRLDDPAPYKPTAQFSASVKRQIREQTEPPRQTEPLKQSEQLRQTEFSNANYTPREADNVVRFGIPQQLERPAEREDSTKVVIVRQKPSNKDMGCWPWKAGSIEHRNCRSSIGLSNRD